jgi:hypothetical protein
LAPEKTGEETGILKDCGEMMKRENTARIHSGGAKKRTAMPEGNALPAYSEII